METDGQDAGAPSVPRFNSIFNWADNDLFSEPGPEAVSDSDPASVRHDGIVNSSIPSSANDHADSVHSDDDEIATPSVPAMSADLQSTHADLVDANVTPSVPSFLVSLEETPDHVPMFAPGPVYANITPSVPSILASLETTPEHAGPVDQSAPQSAPSVPSFHVNFEATPDHAPMFVPGPVDAHIAPSFPSDHVQLFAPGPVDANVTPPVPSIHVNLKATPDHVPMFAPGPANLKPIADFDASTQHPVQLFAPGPATPIADLNATGNSQRILLKPAVRVDDVAVQFYQPSAPLGSASNGLTLTPNVLYMFPTVLPNNAADRHSNAPPPYDQGNNEEDEIEPGQAPTNRGSEMPARWSTMLSRSRTSIKMNADPFADLQPTEVKLSKKRLGAYAGFCKCIKANPFLSSFGILAVIASIIGIVYLSHGNSSTSPLSAPLPLLCNYGFFRTTNNQTHGACAPMRCAAGYQPPLGIYNSTAWSADCVPCLPSTFNANASNNVACQTCAPGKFANESATVACYSCPSRYYCTGPSMPLICTRGSFCLQGSPAPSPCLVGTYQNALGQESCVNCPTGTYCAAGSPVPGACPVGAYCTNPSVLTNCPIGTYNALQNRTQLAQCLPCIAGAYCPTVGSFASTPCSAGSFSALSGSVSCTLSPLGMYVPQAGSTAATNCTAGSFAGSVGQVACALCSAGSFSAFPASASCTSSPVGMYVSVAGSTSALNCTAGSYASSVGRTACVQCAAGYFSASSGSAGCSPSPVGMFVSQAGLTAPTNCTAGSYASTTGQTACVQCSSGSYSSFPGSATCTVSPVGMFVPQAGLTAPTNCTAGSYASTTGQTACVQCSSGSYSSFPGSATCTVSPVGMFVPQVGLTAPTNCTAGSYASTTGQTACVQCSTGSYQSQNGASACVQCTPGWFKSSIGSSSPCVSCSAGSYQPASGASACPLCPMGTYQSDLHAINCSAMVCDVGFTPDATVLGAVLPNATCVGCSVGTYKSVVGNQTCSNLNLITNRTCGVGSYFPLVNSTGYCLPMTCSAGYTPNPNVLNSTSSTLDCVTCPLGSQCPSGQAITCTSGTYCAVGSIVPAACSAGFYCPNASSLIACPAGRYNTLTNQTSLSSCLTCPAGAYCLQGSTNYTQCPSGSYNPQNSSVSAAACLASPAGSYSLVGSTTYTNCSAGMFSAAASQSTCTNCSMGSYQLSKSQTACLLCATGKYVSTVGWSSSACVSCPIGSYEAFNGSSQCSLCPSGTYQSSVGMSTCSPLACVAGQQPNSTYTGAVASTSTSTCVACPVGYYKSLTGNSTCLAMNCSLGREPIDNKTGSVSSTADCSACAAGYYKSSIGNSDCVAMSCPIGYTPDLTVTGSINATSDCDACLATYYKNTTGNAKCSSQVCPSGQIVGFAIGVTSVDGDCSAFVSTCPNGTSYGCRYPTFTFGATRAASVAYIGGNGGSAGPAMSCYSNALMTGLGFTVSNTYHVATQTIAACSNLTAVIANGSFAYGMVPSQTIQAGGVGCSGFDPSTLLSPRYCPQGYAISGISGKQDTTFGATLFSTVSIICSYVKLNGVRGASSADVTIALPNMASPSAGPLQTALCPAGTFVKSFQTRYGCGQDALDLQCASVSVDCNGQSLLCY